MEGKMKVAVMNGIGKMGFTERDIPTPKDDEVLVKLDYVGICGSDLHYYESGAIGDYVVEPPFVLGHEPGGVVVEVGKDVKLYVRCSGNTRRYSDQKCNSETSGSDYGQIRRNRM